MRQVTRGFLAMGLLLGIATTGNAAIITINFDTLTPGPQASSFLAAYGVPSVTFGGTGPGAGAPLIQNAASIFPFVAPSPPNLLQQGATSNDFNQTHYLDFTFDAGLTAFQLTRIGTFGGSSSDDWTATFYNSNNDVVGSFGEIGLFINQPATVFSFTAPTNETIAWMRLESVWQNATFRNILVDDFVLTFTGEETPAVPEPSGITLLGIGALGLCCFPRRKRKELA